MEIAHGSLTFAPTYVGEREMRSGSDSPWRSEAFSCGFILSDGSVSADRVGNFVSADTASDKKYRYPYSTVLECFTRLNPC